MTWTTRCCAGRCRGGHRGCRQTFLFRDRPSDKPDPPLGSAVARISEHVWGTTEAAAAFSNEHFVLLLNPTWSGKRAFRCNPIAHTPPPPLGALPSERSVLVDWSQAAQQLMISAARRGHGLKHWLKSPAVQLLVDLVPVEVHGHQAEQVDVHHLTGAHSADDVWKSGEHHGKIRRKKQTPPFA